jgi:hypothetical protein
MIRRTSERFGRFYVWEYVLDGRRVAWYRVASSPSTVGACWYVWRGDDDSDGHYVSENPARWFM